jgi:hypothetical protein
MGNSLKLVWKHKDNIELILRNVLRGEEVVTSSLSLLQPWATLFVHSLKKVETRPWKTSHRGPLWIHATTNFPKMAQKLCLESPFREALMSIGYPDPCIYPVAETLPRGAIIGLLSLADCFPITSRVQSHRVSSGLGMEDVVIPPGQETWEYQFGNYEKGRYAWVQNASLCLKEPIPVSGGQRIWHWNPEGTAKIIVASDFIGWESNTPAINGGACPSCLKPGASMPLGVFTLPMIFRGGTLF